jgi:23S rRNA pseudouridine2457 synthase
MSTGRHTTTMLFYKPYGTLSQFTLPSATKNVKWKTLAEFGPFPRDVFPAGRLDADSEGLLILTNNPFLQHSLADRAFRHEKTYLVQVERIPQKSALDLLRGGTMRLDGQTIRPARVRLLDAEPSVYPRPVPIRFRKSVPTAWLEIVLTEGKNRQVRRMTAAVGHPTLRLIRTAIGPFTIVGLTPGKWRYASAETVATLTKAARPRSSPRPQTTNAQHASRRPWLGGRRGHRRRDNRNS